LINRISWSPDLQSCKPGLLGYIWYGKHLCHWVHDMTGWCQTWRTGWCRFTTRSCSEKDMVGSKNSHLNLTQVRRK